MYLLEVRMVQYSLPPRSTPTAPEDTPVTAASAVATAPEETATTSAVTAAHVQPVAASPAAVASVVSMASDTPVTAASVVAMASEETAVTGAASPAASSPSMSSSSSPKTPQRRHYTLWEKRLVVQEAISRFSFTRDANGLLANKGAHEMLPEDKLFWHATGTQVYLKHVRKWSRDEVEQRWTEYARHPTTSKTGSEEQVLQHTARVPTWWLDFCYRTRGASQRHAVYTQPPRE